MKLSLRTITSRLRLPRITISLLSLWIQVVAFAAEATTKPNPGIPANWRNIASGWTIPDED